MPRTFKNTVGGEMKLSPTVRASLELLGVDSSANQAELKRAYHKLALLYHPDRNASQSAGEEFQKVTEAYELLSDPLRVEDCNRKYMRERLHRQVVEGLDITFGSFFGYRLFDLGQKAPKAVAYLTAESHEKAGDRARDRASQLNWSTSDAWLRSEENNSILDHPAYDALEVAYAGKFSIQDEERLQGELKGRELVKLPWVILSNQGILRFLEGDLRGARKCYRELCDRVPNNIVFTYRLALCYILDGYKNPRRTFLGRMRPDRIKIERGVELLRHCLKLGEERPVGRQKCLVIRKTLADILEKTGRSREAKSLWQSVLKFDPKSVEANFRVNGKEAASRILKAKYSKNISSKMKAKELTGSRAR